MNSKLITVLASACLVLILIIMAEWFYANQVQKRTLSSITATKTAAVDEVMPEIALIQEPEDSFSDLVDRPLFIKGRKPVAEPLPEEAQTTTATVVNFDWQLNGVYTTKNGLSALFSRVTTRVAKDNYRKITTGTDIDGWKLTEIKSDRAILKQGGQQKDLPLRKSKPKELPKLPNAPNNIPNAPNNLNNPNSRLNIPQPTEGEPEINNENL